jgi:hypothetical protein
VSFCTCEGIGWRIAWLFTSIGGGGAGGRIALYQNSHHTIPPYRGFFDTYGGRGNSDTGSEAGASGTAYIRNTQTAYSQIIGTFM